MLLNVGMCTLAATWKETSVPLKQKQHKHISKNKSTVNGLQKDRNNKHSSLQWEFLVVHSPYDPANCSPLYEK